MVKPTLIFAAPHRLPFLVGALQLVALMGWWLAILSGLHFGTVAPAGGVIPSTLLHAPLLLYLAIPPLFFGFLLTVFPRWMGYPDLGRARYAPVGIGYAVAAAGSWLGLALGMDLVLTIAFFVALLSGLWGTGTLLSVALRERREGKGPTWHGWSILAALAFGLAGQAALLMFLANPAGTYALLIANRIGLWAFLLPVFWTVCHRMVPFFAANVVEGYVRWRPDWLLAALWGGTLVLLAGVLSDFRLLAVAGAASLAGVTALMAFRWWPRNPAPALLLVLVIGFAWAPVGFGLAALQNLGLPINRAPEHALTIGFAGSLIVAMVTRVTQGQSGRPLELPLFGAIAFVGVQAAALARVLAAIATENGPWLVVSAALFVIALAPWVVRNMFIYLTPRTDGKAG